MMAKMFSMGEGIVQEFREIPVTSKRQITIPKSFIDRLAIEGSLQAYLTDDGIFLKPVRKDEKGNKSITKRDLKDIVSQAIAEGYVGEELAE